MGKALSRVNINKNKIAVIGAGGKMGRWFIDFLLNEGFSVYAAHSKKERLAGLSNVKGIKICTNIEAVQECDVLVLSVPAIRFEDVVREIAPHVRAGQVIIDVSSVKVQPLKLLHKYIKKGTVLGVHPMFGPGAKGISGQNFVLTPSGAKEKALATKVQAFLQERGAEVAFITPREHDRQMAVILALSHFIAHVTADTIIKSGLTGKDKASFGTTFKALLTLVSAVLSEDPDFYAWLQMSLHDAPEIEKLFRTRAALWADLVKKGKKDKYALNLVELKRNFDELFPDYKDSYEKMYRVVGK